jgi:hypothetical protein
MRKHTWIILAGLSLLVLSGCSIHPFRTVTVKGRDIALVDPNDTEGARPNITITQTEDGDTYYEWTADISIAQPEPCRLKYHWPLWSSGNLTVNGRLSGSKYPVAFDTGSAPSVVLLNAVHVNRHKLKGLPMGTGENSFYGGLCFESELYVGNIVFSEYPALYVREHNQLQFFGIPIDDDDRIIVGLPIMCRFKYFRLDGPRKELEISLKKSFQTDRSDCYEQYPFTVQKLCANRRQLFVTMPVAGEDMTLFLDTGSCSGLNVGESVWEQMQERTGPVELKKTTSYWYPHTTFQCKKGAIRDLEVGGRTLKKGNIRVYPDNSQLIADKRDGLVGMQFFNQTEIVIDFERNILWVRNEDAD